MVGTPPFYRYTRRTRGEADDSDDEEEDDNYGPRGDVKKQNSGPLRPISLSRDVDRHRHGGTDSQPGSVHLHNPVGAASSSQSSVVRQPSIPAVPESWPPMLPTVPANGVSSARNALTLNSGPPLPGLPPAGNLAAPAPASGMAWEQQAKSLAQLRAQLGLQEVKPVVTPAATPLQPPPNTPLAPLPSPKEMLQNMSQLAQEWRNGAPSSSSSFRSTGAQKPAPATPGMAVVSTASANGVSRMVSAASSNGVSRMSSIEGQKQLSSASARFSGVKVLSAGTGGPSRSRSVSRAPSVERFTSNTSRGPSVERLVSSGSAVAFHQSTPSRLSRTNSWDQQQPGMLSVGATPSSEADRGHAEVLPVRGGPSVRLATGSEGKSLSFESYTRTVSQAPKHSSFRSRPAVLRRSMSLPGAPKSPKHGSLLVSGPLPVPMTPVSVPMTPISMESPSQSGSLNLTPYNRGGSVQLAPPMQASPFPMHSLASSASQSHLQQQPATLPQSTPLPMQAAACTPTPSSSQPTTTASSRFSAPGASPRFPAVALSSPGETTAPMVALPNSAGGSSLLRQPFGSHLVSRGGSVGLKAAAGGLTPQVGPRPSARFERAVAEAAALAAAGPPAETSRILQQLAMQHNMQTLPQTPTRPSQQRGMSPGRASQQRGMSPGRAQQRNVSPNRPSPLWGMMPHAPQQVVAPPMGAAPPTSHQQQHQMAPPPESSNAMHTASQQSLAPQASSPQIFAPPTGGARTVPTPSKTAASSDIAAWTWGASPDDDDESQGIGASLNSTSFSQSMSFLSKSDFDPTYHLAPKLVHL